MFFILFASARSVTFRFLVVRCCIPCMFCNHDEFFFAQNVMFIYIIFLDVQQGAEFQSAYPSQTTENYPLAQKQYSPVMQGQPVRVEIVSNLWFIFFCVFFRSLLFNLF